MVSDLTGRHDTEEDLGPLPYGKEGFPWDAFWGGLALLTVSGLLISSFVWYDLTHGKPTIWPLLVVGLVVVAIMCAVLFFMNIGRQQYANKHFAWWMLVGCIVSILLAALIIILLMIL